MKTRAELGRRDQQGKDHCPCPTGLTPASPAVFAIASIHSRHCAVFIRRPSQEFSECLRREDGIDHHILALGARLTRHTNSIAKAGEWIEVLRLNNDHPPANHFNTRSLGLACADGGKSGTCSDVRGLPTSLAVDQFYVQFDSPGVPGGFRLSGGARHIKAMASTPSTPALPRHLQPQRDLDADLS